jgi:hypothetical protein
MKPKTNVPMIAFALPLHRIARFTLMLSTLLLLSLYAAQAQTVYIGNDLSVTNGGSDGEPPFVILGEYNPAGPSPTASAATTLPGGTVQDLKFYGDTYNFTLYALTFLTNGPNANEQTFRIVASQSFSGSAPTGVQTLPVSGFSVGAGNLLAFAGTGPYYPQNANDALQSDATYEDSSNPDFFTATAPVGVGTIFTVGLNPDTNATYEFVPDYFGNQGRTYAIGVDVSTNGAAANPVPIQLTALNAVITPSNSPTGKFPAVDTTGFFGPAGASIYISAPQVALYKSSGSPTANFGPVDPLQGTFAMNWGAASAFVVYDATGTNRVGTGQLLALSPETGTFDPSNELATSQSAGPVSATMVLENTAGSVVQADDVWIYWFCRFHFPWCPSCPCEGGCPQPGTNTATFVSDPAVNPSVSTETIGVPAVLGGGSWLGTVSGSFQFVGTTGIPTGPSPISPNAIAINLTKENVTAALSGNPTGKLMAVDTKGFFGPAGANVFLSPVQWQAYHNAGLPGAGTGFLDPADGTFSLNWGEVGAFKVFDATGTNQVGTGALATVSPVSGTFDVMTNGFAEVQAVQDPPLNLVLYNNYGGILQPDDGEIIIVIVIYWPWCPACPFPWCPTCPCFECPNNQFGWNVPDPGPDTNEVSMITQSFTSVGDLNVVSSPATLTGNLTFTVPSLPVTTSFGGLQTSPLGVATVNVQANQLVIGNIGSSGLDGVEFNLSAIQGLAMQWEALDPSNSLPVGAYLEEKFFGSGGTVANGLLGTVQVIKQGPSNYITSADFAPMGVTNIEVQALFQGVPQDSAREPNGYLCDCTSFTTDWEYYQNSSQMGPTFHIPGTGAQVDHHGIAVPADALLITPESAGNSPVAMQITAVQLLGSGLPQIVISNASSTVMFGGVAHSSLGNATLNVQSNQLTIANLGASGQDGVEIALPSVAQWDAQWELFDPSNALPVGAYLQMQEVGTANNVTNGLLGTFTVTKMSSNSVLSADFSPIGVTNFTVQLYDGTNVVGEATGLSNGTLCAILPTTGVASTMCVWDQSQISEFLGHWSVPHVRVGLGPGPIYSVNAPVVDNIVISAPRLTEARIPSALLIQASQIPSMVITNETVSPLVLTSTLTSEGLQLQWLGTGVLQASPDLKSWADLPNVVGPYFAPIGIGNQFYRIRQPMGDEINF